MKKSIFLTALNVSLQVAYVDSVFPTGFCETCGGR